MKANEKKKTKQGGCNFKRSYAKFDGISDDDNTDITGNERNK